MRGHAKKLVATKFHPCAEMTIGTTAADNTVRIWDIMSHKCVLTYDELSNAATTLEWSHNGSLISTITKDKVMTIFDPRKEGGAMITNAHEGAKTQKMVWLGDSQSILTTGFTKVSERQYAVWDLRDLS